MLKKALIADDHPVSRNGLGTLLRTEWPEVEILFTSNGEEATDQYSKNKPDLVILDYRMPVLNGLEAAKRILEIDRHAKIILLTMFDTKPIVLNFLKVGGKGFLHKGTNVDQIIQAIYGVLQGDYYFSSECETEISRWLSSGMKEKIPVISFSHREHQLTLKIVRGLTNKEIAAELDLSTRTVEFYRKKLLSKTQVKNTAELVEYIARNGIL